MKAGVPQGSTLGSMLFLIYNNDSPNVNNMKIPMSADDTILYANREMLNKIAKYLEYWLMRWKIHVSIDKRAVIHFAKLHRRRYLKSSVSKQI